MNKLSSYAPVVLRIGLSAVFIWFGLSQITNPGMWASIVPSWALSLSGMTAGTVVLINGIAEIVLGSLLAFGIFTRVVAILLFLHIIIIISDLGLNAIGVRDIGLMFGLASVALSGADHCTCDIKEV